MSLTKALVVALFFSFAGYDSIAAAAAEACPHRPGQPLRFVDVFDGAPEELATLIPDKAGARSGYWELAAIYDAGRFVTIRCKYKDGRTSEVKLSRKVARCSYQIDVRKTLTVRCK